MALIDKIETQAFGTDVFAAAVWFWSTGRSTRQQVITRLGLEASDEPQLDLLADTYVNLPADQKRHFYCDLEAASALLVAGVISRAEFANLLGV